MKLKNQYILALIVANLLLLFSCKNDRNIIDSLMKENDKKRIEITSEFIKTGWLLKNTTNYRLAIEPINVYSLNIDTAKYEDFVENKTYTIDSCMTLFGKDDVKIIYFNKKSKGWTWDKICNRDFDNILDKKRTFNLKENSFYRIMEGYRTKYGYKIFIYVDSVGNVQTFMKPRDEKAL